MPTNYIPANDAEFARFLTNFLTVQDSSLAATGLMPADVSPFSPKQSLAAGG